MGTWSLNIGLDGTFDIQYRANAALIKALNVPGSFTGTIRNRGNMGKSGDEIVQKWNDEHREDPVRLYGI